MRFHELTESRTAPVFHFMDETKAFDVFKHDVMPGRWEHNIPGMGKVLGNSFTRNKNFEFHSRPVRLTMSQERLAQRYKIVPLDGEIIFRNKWNGAMRDGHRDRNLNRKTNALAEEFVVGDIKPLHHYIDCVELTGGNPYMSGADTLELHDVTKRYCEQWNVKLVVHPKFVADMEDIKRRWAEYDEEDGALTEDASGGRFYHVTFASRLPAIRKDGLVLGKRRNWSQQIGGIIGKRAVYMFSTPEMAVRWAHRMEWEFKKPAVILTIDNPPGQVVPDDHLENSMNGGTWFHTDQPVPPECITKVTPMSQDLARELIKNDKVTL